MTLRGHTGPIISIGVLKSDQVQQEDLQSSNSDISSMLFSGGINGAIHLWSVPRNAEPYSAVMDNQYLLATWEQAHEA